MEIITVRIKIIAALGLNSRQYRNLKRALFELWATVVSHQKDLMLESLTTNISLWQWYLNEFDVIESRFYNENSEFVDGLCDSMILNDVLVLMASEIENYYPGALIKMYCNESNNY